MSNASVVKDDNKWVPTQTVMKRLASRGIDVEIAANSSDLFDTLKATIETAEIERGKVAVVVYVLTSRSYTIPEIVKEINNFYTEATVRTLAAEGLVHLRCDEVHSVIDASNAGSLTLKELEEITDKRSASDNSAAVREAAIKKRFTASQVTQAGKEVEVNDKDLAVAIDEVTSRTGLTVPAVVAELSKQKNTKPKPRSESANGGTELQTVEFYLKTALKAAKTHAPEGYEMTSADLTALARFITGILFTEPTRHNLFDMIKNKVQVAEHADAKKG